VLLPTWTLDLVIQADLGSGDRAVVSSATVGTGQGFSFPRNIDIDAAGNQLILADSQLNAVVAMDLDSGDRSILSDNAAVGTGPAFVQPLDVAVDAVNDRVIVMDATGLIAVDLTSGDRTIIANDVTGAGPSLAGSDGVDIDVAAGFAYVANTYDDAFEHLIYKVNLVSGDRTVLSDTVSAGTGTALNFPSDIGLDIDGNRALVLNRGGVQENLMAVDLTTGDRSIVSGAGVGSGQEFGSNERLDLDMQNDRAFVYDLAVGGVIVVDLTTGERAVATK
jgi:DNA-binding beta-propeller fold protein YncE